MTSQSEAVKRYRETPKGKAVAYEANERYYQKNRGEILEYKRRYYQENKERLSALSKAWIKNNPTQARLSRLEWKKKNRGKVNIYQQGRRVRKLGLRISNRGNKRLLQRVYEDNIKKYGTLTCVLCNKVVEFGSDSIDHLTPLCRGGKHIYENLGVAHKSCNFKKNAKTLQEWLVLDMFIEAKKLSAEGPQG